MDLLAVLIWGFAGTTVLTTIMRASQMLRWTRMDIPLILGLIVTPDRDRARVYGFLMHLVNGWIFAAIYAASFHLLDLATWWLGIGIGAIHGFFVLLVGLPALPGVHPRMATDSRGPEPTLSLQPPGFLAANYGKQTAIATFVAHLVFGLILGAFYPGP